MLEKFRKNNKKGFTLVELIVVLVILAILAALLIPALTGYIDKAKEKQIVAETRQIVMAAQTVLDEKYAKENVGASVTIEATDADKIKALSEVSELTIVNNLNADGQVKITVANAKVTEVEYKARDLKCKYTVDDGYVVAKKGESYPD